MNDLEIIIDTRANDLFDIKNGFIEEGRNRISKRHSRFEADIVSHVLVHEFPQSFDGIKVRAIGRQVVQYDALCLSFFLKLLTTVVACLV